MMSQPMLATTSHPQHLHHPQQTQQQQQQQQQQQRDNNDIEDFLNILIDDNTHKHNNNKSPQQLSPCNQQPSPSFNIPQQQQQRQPQHFGGGSPINNGQMQLATSPPTNVPEVKIKCEDNSASDYPLSDGDGFIDDMSPFHSGVSSPGSSCSAMSGPGSPILMDSNSQPPFNQNYLTPESAFYMQPGSPTHSGGDSAGSSYKYDPRPLGRKKRRTLVPDDKKNTEYWEKRKRNNLAARRSREERRTKELQTFETMKHLQQENNALKQTVKMLMESQNELQKEIFSLRHCLEVSQAMLNNKQIPQPNNHHPNPL
eukprot:TCONS_00067691-protein